MIQSSHCIVDILTAKVLLEKSRFAGFEGCFMKNGGCLPEKGWSDWSLTRNISCQEGKVDIILPRKDIFVQSPISSVINQTRHNHRIYNSLLRVLIDDCVIFLLLLYHWDHSQVMSIFFLIAFEILFYLWIKIN